MILHECPKCKDKLIGADLCTSCTKYHERRNQIAQELFLQDVHNLNTVEAMLDAGCHRNNIRPAIIDACFNDADLFIAELKKRDKQYIEETKIKPKK